MTRKDLARFLEEIEKVYTGSWPGGDAKPTSDDIGEVVRTYSRLASEGYVLRTHHADEIAALLERAGRSSQAKAFRSVAIR